ncbi:unnamed protein product [Pedinophyceae sp. YPF-701]|nr:unnamed protein product [Pedinophyceae sp. YPF-701]
MLPGIGGYRPPGTMSGVNGFGGGRSTMVSASGIRGFDFYRTLPKELTESSLAGIVTSLLASLFIVMLVGYEFADYMTPDNVSELVVDRSDFNEVLRVTFNVSFPALSCEHLEVDVKDAVGTRRYNMTRTVTRTPISADLERAGLPQTARSTAQHSAAPDGPKYDDYPPLSEEEMRAEEKHLSEALTSRTFDAYVHKHPVVMVNFFAPWCPWCQRLAPTWEEATRVLFQRHGADNDVRFARVDCTASQDLCKKYQIQAYPAIRVFTKGSDESAAFVDGKGHHAHVAYQGDRTVDALVTFAEAVSYHRQKAPAGPLDVKAALANSDDKELSKVVGDAHKAPGCNINGFLLVKKVPGAITMSLVAPGHSLDAERIDTSHVVHKFFFGLPLATREAARVLKRMHPHGLTRAWMDKFAGAQFESPSANMTHEHYMQVVLTTMTPLGRGVRSHDAYEYTLHSHSYSAEGADQVPETRFSYEPSPIQIMVSERRQPLYHFVTSLCAVVGGVFTVMGMLGGGIGAASAALKKKLDLGKQY